MQDPSLAHRSVLQCCDLHRTQLMQKHISDTVEGTRGHMHALRMDNSHVRR